MPTLPIIIITDNTLKKYILQFWKFRTRLASDPLRPIISRYLWRLSKGVRWCNSSWYGYDIGLFPEAFRPHPAAQRSVSQTEPNRTAGVSSLVPYQWFSLYELSQRGRGVVFGMDDGQYDRNTEWRDHDVTPIRHACRDVIKIWYKTDCIWIYHFR